PALPAAKPQASACMRSGRMPINMAALRSSATARSWLPTVVRVSKRCSAKVSAIAATPATSCGTGIRMPATLSVPDNETCGSETKTRGEDQKGGEAQQQREPEGRKNRRQHGPAHHMTDEREEDDAAEHERRKRGGKADRRRPPAEPHHDEQRHVHAEHDELAMG